MAGYLSTGRNMSVKTLRYLGISASPATFDICSAPAESASELRKGTSQ